MIWYDVIWCDNSWYALNLFFFCQAAFPDFWILHMNPLRHRKSPFTAGDLETMRFFQDGLTGSAWGDWANYTDSPLRSGVKSPGYNTLPEWEKPKNGCSLSWSVLIFSFLVWNNLIFTTTLHLAVFCWVWCRKLVRELCTRTLQASKYTVLCAMHHAKASKGLWVTKHPSAFGTLLVFLQTRMSKSSRGLVGCWILMRHMLQQCHEWQCRT